MGCSISGCPNPISIFDEEAGDAPRPVIAHLNTRVPLATRLVCITRSRAIAARVYW